MYFLRVARSLLRASKEKKTIVKLELSKLGSRELKELSVAVKTERERRGKKNPNNHEPPTWVIPNKAISSSNVNAA